MTFQSLIPIHHARRNLGELVNEAFYQGKPFMLKRGNKPMAALVGANEWREMIKALEKYNPGLADTLALMADPALEKMLDDGEQDIKAGRTLPFDERTLRP